MGNEEKHSGQSRRFSAHGTQRVAQLQGLELASFGSRLAGLMIDIAVASAILMAVTIGGAAILNRFTQAGQDTSHIELKFGFQTWYGVVYATLYFGLSAYLGQGKTPGKRMMGIRIVSLLHERLSLWHSIERAMGYGASMLEGGFGFLQYFIHPNCQTVHDRIAETIVIRDRPARTEKQLLREG